MNMSVNMGRPYSFTNGNWQSSSSSGQAIVLSRKEQDFEQLTLQILCPQSLSNLLLQSHINTKGMYIPSVSYTIESTLGSQTTSSSIQEVLRQGRSKLEAGNQTGGSPNLLSFHIVDSSELSLLPGILVG